MPSITSKEIVIIILGITISILLTILPLSKILELNNFEAIYLILALSLIFIVLIIWAITTKTKEINEKLSKQSEELKKQSEKLKIHEQLINIKAEIKELQKEVFK